MDFLFVVGGAALIFAIIAGILYLKKKSNLSDADLELIMVIANTINYIIDSMGIKYSDQLSKVIEYTIEAIDVAMKYEDAETLVVKKDIIKDELMIILEREGIEVDEKMIEVIDDTIEYVINNNYIK